MLQYGGWQMVFDSQIRFYLHALYGATVYSDFVDHRHSQINKRRIQMLAYWSMWDTDFYGYQTLCRRGRLDEEVIKGARRCRLRTTATATATPGASWGLFPIRTYRACRGSGRNARGAAADAGRRCSMTDYVIVGLEYQRQGWYEMVHHPGMDDAIESYVLHIVCTSPVIITKAVSSNKEELEE